jgi:hypothetical protein
MKMEKKFTEPDVDIVTAKSQKKEKKKKVKVLKNNLVR